MNDKMKLLKLKPGDIYEDCAFHPVFCTSVNNDDVEGISLIDGSMPRRCSIKHCGVRKLTIQQALDIKKQITK